MGCPSPQPMAAVRNYCSACLFLYRLPQQRHRVLEIAVALGELPGGNERFQANDALPKLAAIFRAEVEVVVEERRSHMGSAVLELLQPLRKRLDICARIVNSRRRQFWHHAHSGFPFDGGVSS